MKKQSEEHSKIQLMSATFPNVVEAKAVLNDLVKMHKAGSIQLLDAAVLVRDEDGKLTVTERGELTPKKGARRGALIGVALGVIFPPSLLAGAAIGAAAGAVTGKVTDQGFANEMLQEIGAELESGKSAIIAVVEHTWYAQMMDAVEGYEKVVGRAFYADEAGSITWTE
jgi:uncharacterized membrane protein